MCGWVNDSIEKGQPARYRTMSYNVKKKICILYFLNGPRTNVEPGTGQVV